MALTGRKSEIAELNEASSSGRPEFVAVYGRRRVGKTFLVKSLFEKDFTFFFTGIANSDRQESLSRFSEAISEYSAAATDVPKDWFDAFRILRSVLERSRRGRKIVFLDELPWMDTPGSNLIKALEYFWNSWASARDEIMLIVCGSAASWVIDKLLNDHGGLYGRITRRIRMEPFTLGECEQYYAENGFVYSRRQIVEGYMVFGGIPYYLNMLRKRESIVKNIERLCFDRGGALRMEFDHVFASLFRNADRHRRIIEALATKSKGLSRGDIAGAASIPNGGNLTKALSELEASGFIRAYGPFVGKKKGMLYQLIDPYTLFYLRIIARSPDDDKYYWAKYRESAGFRSWSGYAFEQVCLSHTMQLKKGLGVSGVISRTYSWRSAHSDPGAQIDLVIDRNDGVISLCEIKFSDSEYAITKEVDASLRRKREVFRNETRTKKAVQLVMVTLNGLKQNMYYDTIQAEVDAKDLFDN
jgi:AAA+ ATPase superfamily predicted ATPase